MALLSDTVIEEAIAQSSDRTQLWVNLVTELNCKSLCEIGVWKGEFAQALLQNVPGIERYVMIDPWRNLPDWNKPANRSDVEFDDIRNEALGRVAAFNDKLVEIRDTTKNARDKIEDDSLDFVYVDGDHTLRGITIDLLSIVTKVKQGGFIGGDDFTKTIWQHGQEFSPTEVFPFAVFFAEAYDFTIYTLPFNQFLILKGSDGFTVKDYGGYKRLSPADIYLPPKKDSVLRKTLRRLRR